MRERQILFSGPMVSAILDGRKTQTRRVMKPQPETETTAGQPMVRFGPGGWFGAHIAKCAADCAGIKYPYGQPGDRLWVRETWRTDELPTSMIDGVWFRADDSFVPIDNTSAAADHWADAHDNGRHGQKWRPSIFMPRWACRLELAVTDVRVERLQEISEDDAKAEGVTPGGYSVHPSVAHKCAFEDLWDSINSKRGFGWDVSPWVWVVTFKRRTS